MSLVSLRFKTTIKYRRKHRLLSIELKRSVIGLVFNGSSGEVSNGSIFTGLAAPVEKIPRVSYSAHQEQISDFHSSAQVWSELGDFIRTEPDGKRATGL